MNNVSMDKMHIVKAVMSKFSTAVEIMNDKLLQKCVYLINRSKYEHMWQ